MPNTLIQPYLFFGGRCEEALAFYGRALGATVDFKMLYKDSPEPMKPGMIPPGFEGKVMHATFRVGDNVMMASDGNEVGGKFDGFFLSLNVATEAEAKKAFTALADGGAVKMPLGKTFWAPMFGMLVDRFGIGWMVSIPGYPAK
jgi:PhnB protein